MARRSHDPTNPVAHPGAGFDRDGDSAEVAGHLAMARAALARKRAAEAAALVADPEPCC